MFAGIKSYVVLGLIAICLVAGCGIVRNLRHWGDEGILERWRDRREQRVNVRSGTVRAIDGPTLLAVDLDGRRGRRARPQAVRIAWIEATDNSGQALVEKLLPIGSPCQVVLTDERRLVSSVTDDAPEASLLTAVVIASTGKNVGLELVKAGHARPTAEAPDEYQDAAPSPKAGPQKPEAEGGGMLFKIIGMIVVFGGLLLALWPWLSRLWAKADPKIESLTGIKIPDIPGASEGDAGYLRETITYLSLRTQLRAAGYTESAAALDGEHAARTHAFQSPVVQAKQATAVPATPEATAAKGAV